MSARIDLRSDTVTQPSDRMRRAMANAEVGDDWYGDDPTVNLLQARAAELTGKEAAIYLPTGTMCNQVALHAYVRSGHRAVCEATAHVGRTELSSAAALSGVAFQYLTAPDRGLLLGEQVAVALAPDPDDVAVVDLVSIENTHQVGGGSVLSVAGVRDIAAVCAAAGVPLYLDGARIFNACAVAEVPVAAYASAVSSMMFCLSKGLGAPIGSILAGDREFIAEARRLKILFGGAWRQAGIMAAAGLIALEEGPARLPEDHANARILAEGLAELLPESIDPDAVETNIVFIDVSGTGRGPAEWREMLAAEGLLVTILGGRVRMLTHVGIGADDIEAALTAWRRAAKAA
ncbi:MAG TPA: GntG family PLP-dependent aldolase [Streptosporangiaceae bacterium]|nr:GntG family PLP-dependent aldolase [Streptosporangiaceae bacterium]